MSDHDHIPAIHVSTSDLTQRTEHQSGAPPSSGLLSPQSPQSRDPSSPSHSDDGSSIPPSPTLTNRSSVHFQPSSSLALRENKPDASSGKGSFGLLDVGQGKGHHRKGSNATVASTSETTEPDHDHDSKDLQHVKTTSTTITKVARSTFSSNKDGKDEKQGTLVDKDAEDEQPRGVQAELAQDANMDPAPFSFKPYQLAHMLDPKSLAALEEIDGSIGLLKGLGTDPTTGLLSVPGHGDGRPGAGQGASQRHQPSSTDEQSVPAITLTEPGGALKEGTLDASGHAYTATLDDRRRVFGANILPQRKSKTFLQLAWAALKDKVLILLSIAAVVSLALGFFQDFGPGSENNDEPPVDWVEGVAIMVAILIVVLVGSLNDWQKERQFKVLNDKKEERGVKVIRDGHEKIIDIKEVVVGDIAFIEPGEIVPCDGIFLSGHNVKCDESAATGESDAIKKVTYDECIALRDKNGEDPVAHHTDCFIVSGSKVLEGVGRYVVVAVGTKSFNGRIMMALRGDAENTPLQLKLNNLAELIAKLGSAAGIVLFTALMIRYFVRLGRGEFATPNDKGIKFVDILIISVTLIVVAVPEGLPLAVTLALAFATKRMTYENLLVRVLGSCETMANASVVCTDKTGTLTQNEMTVVAGAAGIHAKFVAHLDENAARTNAEDRPNDQRRHAKDFSIDQSQLNECFPPSLQVLFNEAISVNSTAFEDTDADGKKTLVGSKTETALLKFSRALEWKDFQAVRDAANVVQMIPFSSERKAMGVVVKLSDGKYRVYLKGASEILTRKCSQHVVVHKPGEQSDRDEVLTEPIDDLANDNISRTIIFYANQTLRTIALCYKDFDSWPPKGSHPDEQNEVPYDDLAVDLTLIAVVGIEDPLRPGVRDAVTKCTRAGVGVKMCTGDNALTARSIAAQCGIFTPGGIIMEGPVFRTLSPQDLRDIVPRLQVLARSSPADKQLLVETLRSLGDVVGVTGDGTNDGPALKAAHIGFSMGIAGTEVAKEASDIILMDDNFASIVKAIIWGRCVNDAVRKFLQFQISVNITAVIITFVSAVASVEEESVLSAVQLLWINIIMDTFAALALATDPASEALLDRKPDKPSAPLFTVDMYKQIFGQSMYQTTIILIFHFLGRQILGFGDDTTVHDPDDVVQTLVFNAFVFAQIFNSVNSRRLDRHLNVFEGIHRNWYFISITLLEIVIQIVIVFVGGAAFTVTRMGGREWGISIALGFVSIPLGILIRLLPNGPFETFFDKVGLFGRPEVLPTQHPENEQWNMAITQIRNNLNTFSNVRGGRMRSSSLVLKSRNASVAPEQQSIPMSSLLAMAPTLMVGSIATGQSYAQPGSGSLSDPAHSDPSKSSAALWEGKLQLHPDTDPSDPAYKRFGGAGGNNEADRR